MLPCKAQDFVNNVEDYEHIIHATHLNPSRYSGVHCKSDTAGLISVSLLQTR